MKFTQLSNDEVKRLEQTTIRVEMVVRQELRNVDPHLVAKIHSWYHSYGLKPSKSQKKMWTKLIELFGCKPNYYVTHVCKNAIWGFEWKGQKIIFYKDERGISIQVPEKSNKKLIVEFLIELKNTLIAPGYEEEHWKF